MSNTFATADVSGAFALFGGRPCLNLVATLGKRHTRPVERLPDEMALARWLLDAGLPARVAIQPPSAGQLESARELREVINRLVRGTMNGERLDPDDVDRVNHFAAGPDLAPQLRVNTGHPEMRERHPEIRGSVWIADDLCDAALASLARDAISLLTGQYAGRIKECEHPECSLLFLDDSQSGNRRWCSMRRCGNLTKVAGYRSRRAGVS
jgi:predicted RNA-binding Zn ribbon-like protein